MKKTFSKSLFLLPTLSLLSYKGPSLKEDLSGVNIAQKIDAAQKIEILIDGNKKTSDPEALLTSGYTGAHFVLGYLSDKDDLQFTISAYVPDLKTGSYQVYECISCNETMPDNNQTAFFGPYPKDPMPPLNLFRSAYYAPDQGLHPLTLVITSITDEQQAGNPFKTKRVKGQFSGSLAYGERQGDNVWHIVGKTSNVEGSFNMLCSLR